MVPEQGTQSQTLGHTPVRAHLCEAQAKLWDPKRAAARAEATAETPHGRQSTPQPLSFLCRSYSSVSVPQSPTAQQQEGSCSAGPGPHWPGWQPCPSPFSCCRRQETVVEEEEETVISDQEASQCIQAERLVSQLHPLPPSLPLPVPLSGPAMGSRFGPMTAPPDLPPHSH